MADASLSVEVPGGQYSWLEEPDSWAAVLRAASAVDQTITIHPAGAENKDGGTAHVPPTAMSIAPEVVELRKGVPATVRLTASLIDASGTWHMRVLIAGAHRQCTVDVPLEIRERPRIQIPGFEGTLALSHTRCIFCFLPSLAKGASWTIPVVTENRKEIEQRAPKLTLRDASRALRVERLQVSSKRVDGSSTLVTAKAAGTISPGRYEGLLTLDAEGLRDPQPFPLSIDVREGPLLPVGVMLMVVVVLLIAHRVRPSTARVRDLIDAVCEAAKELRGSRLEVDDLIQKAKLALALGEIRRARAAASNALLLVREAGLLKETGPRAVARSATGMEVLVMGYQLAVAFEDALGDGDVERAREVRWDATQSDSLRRLKRWGLEARDFLGLHLPGALRFAALVFLLVVAAYSQVYAANSTFGSSPGDYAALIVATAAADPIAAS